MKYVISDLHGEYSKFLEMLELIHFSDNDELYILGDVLDRGKQSIQIIDYIRSSKNIHFILGNHEQLYMMAYDNPSYMVYWLQNGGDATYAELKELGIGYMKDLYNYLKDIPLYIVIDKFILVHAGIYVPDNAEDISLDELMSIQSHDDLLWSRDFINSNKAFKDYTVICGHTPTINYMKDNKKAKILHSPGKIMIDCGAVFKEDNGCLSCLRLDDLEEFYIN